MRTSSANSAPEIRIDGLRWWRQETPVGEMTVVAGDAGLCRIHLNGSDPPDGDFERDARVAAELDDYFAGRRRRFTVPVDLSGVKADFKRCVLDTLYREVGYGETVSYGELAIMAGRPGAARAVGSAMASNPIAVVVPCHRVLAAGGRIGGYGGGLATKRALLALEGVEVA